MKRYTQEEKEKYCKLVDELGYAEVHKKYGINKATLRQWKDPEYKKSCQKIAYKWNEENPDYNKQWREKQGTDYSTEQLRKWVKNNVEKNKEIHKKSFNKLKNDPTRYKEKIKRDTKYSKDRYHNDDIYQERVKKQSRKYYKNNKESCLRRFLKYQKRRRKEDPEFRLLTNMRTRLWCTLKGSIKEETTKDLLGCTTKELKLYLEKQFLNGMNWDNYGEWEVDHIKPCSSFNLLNEEERKECFHYSNLQPLWKGDNREKHDKII